MEAKLVEPSVWIFLLQALAAIAYIPFSYIAYQRTRVPVKQERLKQPLLQLGFKEIEHLYETVTHQFIPKDYFWPVFLATGVTFFSFSTAHSFIVNQGLLAGVIEVYLNVFGENDLADRAVFITRISLWVFMGAYLYSFHLIFRRFLAFDLTPSVYIFVANRFVIAFFVGIFVASGVGTYSRLAGVSLDANLATVSIVAFFIGFFPDQGMDWIFAIAQKTLKHREGLSKEIQLSEIEGMSIWHQGRLKQEGLDNVQNLATVDMQILILSTPYSASQIVDWIDQAILLVHTSRPQFKSLEKIGIIRASDFLSTTNDNRSLTDLVEATGANKSELKVLSKVLKSALNIKLVTHFRWQSGLAPDQDKNILGVDKG